MTDRLAGNITAEFKAPVSGRVVSLAAVPDPVFSGGMLGDGLAIDPSDGAVLAPAAGTVTTLFPTGHALALRLASGVEILVHVGVDTVKLGRHFSAAVSEGDEVAAGQILVRFDLDALRREAPSVLTPVIVVHAPEGVRLKPASLGSRVVAGETTVARLVAEGDLTE